MPNTIALEEDDDIVGRPFGVIPALLERLFNGILDGLEEDVGVAAAEDLCCLLETTVVEVAWRCRDSEVRFTTKLSDGGLRSENCCQKEWIWQLEEPQESVLAILTAPSAARKNATSCGWNVTGAEEATPRQPQSLCLPANNLTNSQLWRKVPKRHVGETR
ncbi:hypothetical protein B0T26DRAFT_680815 [Lasiosphaeria miniovina]|uniref:Uncharacterized protein n=1 Tax=Lasiosphaeria miniovina TaxID=1954250 RepID=A0AA39ZSU9_9PEZI|nr:uncharacterized protein B0T26DRAFT_680815 [Lasiosphaeria miniovina]KAK0703066.1 hypothetical protein B0T26DRAFT_680815 [Lasiosphaeria miniovina]